MNNARTKAKGAEKQIRLNGWTFVGIDDMTGYQRAAMMAAIEYNQMHPVYVQRVFHFDGKVTVDHNTQEVNLEPVTVRGWRILGSYLPSRIEAKKFANLVEIKKDFTGSDLRTVFGHHACVINRDTKEVKLWNIFGTNIGMGDDDYPMLDVELAHVRHGVTEEQIRSHTGHMGPIHIDEDRCELRFYGF